MLGMTTLYSEASNTVTDINRMNRQLENSLFATDLLGNELSLSGYWGEAGHPIDADDATYGPLRHYATSSIDNFPSPAPACIGTGRSGFTPHIELGWGMEHHLVSGSGAQLASELASGSCVNIPSIPSDNTFFALRRASTCYIGQDECTLDEGAHYIQTNGCVPRDESLNGGEINIARVYESNIHQMDYMLYGCELTSPLYSYSSNIYYVNENEQLVRLYFDKGEYVEQLVVEGVEHLSFQWYIDTNGDLEHDTVTTTLTEWNAKRIRGVKIWMVVRGMEPIGGFEDTNTYQIAGQPWSPPTENLSYPRILRSHMVDVSRVVTVERRGGNRK